MNFPEKRFVQSAFRELQLINLLPTALFFQVYYLENRISLSLSRETVSLQNSSVKLLRKLHLTNNSCTLPTLGRVAMKRMRLQMISQE